jgi:hypothetical protein
MEKVQNLKNSNRYGDVAKLLHCLANLMLLEAVGENNTHKCITELYGY